MKIDSVDVTGMSTTPADKVNAIVHQLVGQNVVRARTKVVESQLEKLPTVSGAHVGRLLSWPPRATVRLDERQAMAVVGAGENLLVVDQTGMPFRKADVHGQDRDLVSVGLIEVNVQLGKRLPDKHWSRISEWLTALQDDNKSGSWTWKPRRVFYDKDAISMWVPASPTTEKGPELLIRLGGDRWEEKLARARETLAYFGRTGRDAETLDLVSYDRPVWHPRDQVKTVNKSGDKTEAVNPEETPAAEATPEAPAPVAPTATAPHLAHGDAAGHREG
jgi:hypothetical protein